MKTSILFTICLAFAVDALNHQDINIQVFKEAGRISVSKAGGKGRMIFAIDSIKEKDADGNDVGLTSSSTKHAVRFGQVTFNEAGPFDETFEGLDVVKTVITASSFLKEDGPEELVKEVFLFKQDGEFTIDGHKFQVKDGDMKSNTYLKNWPYCDDSRECFNDQGERETGAYVEINLSVTDTGKIDKEDKDDIIKYRFANNVEFTMMKKVQVDGAYVDMPAGYPTTFKAQNRGAKQTFLYAMPKGTEVMYDPYWGWRHLL